MDTIALSVQIPSREIAFLTFILDSYEGIATIRTVDPEKGIVELMVSPHQTAEIKEILSSLGDEFPIRYLTPLNEGLIR